MRETGECHPDGAKARIFGVWVVRYGVVSKQIYAKNKQGRFLVQPLADIRCFSGHLEVKTGIFSISRSKTKVLQDFHLEFIDLGCLSLVCTPSKPFLDPAV